MSYHDTQAEEPAYADGEVVPSVEDNHYFDEPTVEEFSATETLARLLAQATTPGQVAAVLSVLRLDERRPCEIALSLRMSRQRFNQLRKQAQKRVEFFRRGVDGRKA